MNDHFRFNRVGNKALLMRQVMQLLLGSGRGLSGATVDNFWIERDPADPRYSLFVFGHHSNRFVVIVFNLESLFAGQIKECEHMAARNGCHVGFFGIHVSRI